MPIAWLHTSGGERSLHLRWAVSRWCRDGRRDATGGACASLSLPDGTVGTTAIESKANFLGAVREGATITATAAPPHRGRATIVVETELRLDDDRLVGKTTQTPTLFPR